MRSTGRRIATPMMPASRSGTTGRAAGAVAPSQTAAANATAVRSLNCRERRRPDAASDRGEVTEPGELGLADAGHVEQRLDRDERAVLIAVTNDGGSEGRSDAR